MRAITRITGVSINTVTKLLVDAGEACAAYHDEHVRGIQAKRIQCDESPMLHIEGFSTEAEAQAWIANDSVAWFAKLADAHARM
jgi:hypothetical protein